MDDVITASDGVHLTVRTWTPIHHQGSAVVLVHGFAASKDDLAVVAVAEHLSAAGHTVLSYTARGHGDSGGECTLGDLEHLDVEAAVARAGHDADQVVLVGASMGAIAVLRHAATTAVAGVVTVSSPAEWRVPRTLQSAAAALLTQTPPGRWFARRTMGVRLAAGWSGAAAPVDLAASIEVPLVVIHGRNDRFIKHTEAEKLHAAAAGPTRLEVVDAMGHAYAAESIPSIVDGVSWALSHVPEQPAAGV